MVTMHRAKIMLITPPPLDEYQQDEVEFLKGFQQPRRNAATTKKYADACREVGHRLGIPVVDIWSAFMKVAGWKEGKTLEGSKELPPNSKLNELLIDGTLPFSCLVGLFILPFNRFASWRRWV